MTKITTVIAPCSELGNDPNDFRDVPDYMEKLAPVESESSGKKQLMPFPPVASLITTEEEMQAAKLAPKCIAKDYIYANLRSVIAAGGTGKTTLCLHESVMISLGRDVWGCKVHNPGWTLFVSAEDERERLIALKRSIIDELELDKKERATAIKSLVFWDVTGKNYRLAEGDDAGGISPSELAQNVINGCKESPPVNVIFDPMISFGVDEGRVNVNEQAIIVAARHIVNGLGCCVTLIHHTGKGNARDKTRDQYSGRGGSALPDGSRMVHVINSQPVDSKDRPAGCTQKWGKLTVITRAKMTYSKPGLPDIWIERKNYSFQHHIAISLTAEQKSKAREDQLHRFIESNRNADPPVRFTKSELEGSLEVLGMSRSHLREALAGLTSKRRVELEEVDRAQGAAGRARVVYAVIPPPF